MISALAMANYELRGKGNNYELKKDGKTAFKNYCRQSRSRESFTWSY